MHAVPEVACPSEEQLRAFQLGTLSDEDLDRVASHLEECPSCNHVVQRLDGFVDPLLVFLRDASLDSRVEAESASFAVPTHSVQEGATATDLSRLLQPASAPDELGRFGNYRVLRLIGAGGMAQVYEAEDLALARLVALKVMKPEFYRDGEQAQRFLREARTLASIKHDNVVMVHHAGNEGPVVYLAMELLEGEPLDQWLKHSPRPASSELMRLAREICSGLAAVHGQGLIHRDIKPSNVWLEGPDRRVKILDFGLARAVDDDAGITQHGAILGTPAFMSPEQASGARVDARSDLFSLGCLLYCLASGARPFPAENTMATLSALANRTPTPIRELNPEVLPAVAELIGQLLAKSPEERPASAEAVLERLAEIENDPRAANRAAEKRSRALLLTTTGSRRRRWLKAAALLTVVCGLLFGGGYLVQWYYWLFPTKLPFPDPPPGSTFLTEFKPVETENWPFHPYLPPDRANDGVYVQHRYFEKGILTHPAPEPFPDRPLTSGLTYDIAQRFRKLGGMVSVKDMPLGAGSRAPITFSIFGDGKLLWESRPVQFQRDSQQFDVDVAGVKLLKILASTPVGSQPHGAFAVWVEPYLTK